MTKLLKLLLCKIKGSSPKQTHLPCVLISARLLSRLRGHAGRGGDFFDAFGELVGESELLEDFLGSVDESTVQNRERHFVPPLLGNSSSVSSACLNGGPIYCWVE